MESFGILSMLATLMQTPTPLETSASASISEPAVLNESADDLFNTDTTPTYSIDVKTNCKIYNPFPQKNEVFYWSGDCKDGYAHGTGSDAIYVNGKLVEQAFGTYNKGKITGNGTLKMFDSDENLEKTYTGTFAESIMHGIGKITWADGSVYEGRFRNGDKWGYGKLTMTAENNALREPNILTEIGSYDDNGNVIIEGIFIDDKWIQECKKEDCPTELIE